MVNPNQSFLVKQMQGRIAAAMACVFYDLGAACSESVPLAWNNPNSVLTYSSGWRRNNQSFILTGSPFPYIKFDNTRWDPENGKVDYGPKKIAQTVNVEDDGLTKVIRNDTDGDIHVSYSESVSLTNSFSSRISKGLTMDMTIGSETTVSGSYAGVSAEEKLSLEFGISKTSEEEKEQGQEGTKEQALAIDFDATARNYYLLTILKEQGNFYQDYDINAVQDFDIHAKFNTKTWNKRRNGKYLRSPEFDVVGVDGFLQFIHGYDINYPRMENYFVHAPQRVKDAIAWIENANNRRIQVSGRNQGSLEKNADFHVELLGNNLPDGLAHLPVKNADDLGIEIV